MNKILCSILFLFIGIVTSSATAQYPDKIIYQGTEYMLHTNPLEQFFKEYPDKKPTVDLLSTALWRGYVATFEILDGLLYVKDIQIEVSIEKDNGEYDYDWKSVIDDVFKEGESKKMDWFSGILILPHGETEHYVHMGYASVYSNYILLEIEKGTLKKEKKFDHKEFENFKEKQFQAFKKTEEYKKLFQELKTDREYSDEYINSFLRDFVIEYSSKFYDEE